MSEVFIYVYQEVLVMAILWPKENLEPGGGP
jgi:hypothetical protein